MRVFVTGLTGFIGKHLKEQLIDRHHDILALSRKQIEGINCVQSDLDNMEQIKDIVRDFKPDAIAHLAWEGIPDYSYKMSRKNLEHGLNMLELCRYSRCKTILFTGSCWEYEDPCGVIKENHKLSYKNSFKSAKNCLNHMAKVFCEENEIDMYWTRLFYVYGPGQKENSLIPSIIKEMKAGETPKVLTPHNKNDFVYVETVADCILSILEQKPQAKTINIGSGEATPILEILKYVAEYIGYNVDVSSMERKQDNIVDFCACTEEMKKLKIRETSISEGLKKTIDSFL